MQEKRTTLLRLRECCANHSRRSFAVKISWWCPTTEILSRVDIRFYSALFDEDPSADPLPACDLQSERGESSSRSLPATSRESATATGSLPAPEKISIVIGRLVGERTELTTVLQLTSLFCDVGRYLEKELCVRDFEAEKGFGRKSCHSKVCKYSPAASNSQKIISSSLAWDLTFIKIVLAQLLLFSLLVVRHPM